jgi:2-amino-4-hydroxy-6-hydroxymethyldihydropteridine diphosphokinase
MPKVYLALGTNQGDRVQHLRRALERLAPYVSLTQLSPLYETAPWGITDQPDFLNMAAEGVTTLSPFELLDALKNIEQAMGRQATVRYGPRVIDLDILLYGELVMQTERLEIPHARMAERAFVLIPLQDLAPDLIHPRLQRTVRELVAGLPNRSGIRKFQTQIHLTDVTPNN